MCRLNCRFQCNSLAAQCTRRKPTHGHATNPHGRARARSHRLPVVATSEFWWEDEQEFDALTEVLLPKQVMICCHPVHKQQLSQLRRVSFVAAFSSPASKAEAEQLWQELGRAGPPLFLKVRPRQELQDLEQDTSNHEAAEQFWQEITAQSWRMDLDYGLNKDATLQAAAEPLLVVLSNRQALQQLVAAAVQQTTGNCGFESEGLCMVQVDGWNQGEQQQQLESWRQLQPRPVPLPAAQDAAL